MRGWPFGAGSAAAPSAIDRLSIFIGVLSTVLFRGTFSMEYLFMSSPLYVVPMNEHNTLLTEVAKAIGFLDVVSRDQQWIHHEQAKELFVGLDFASDLVRKSRSIRFPHETV